MGYYVWPAMLLWGLDRLYRLTTVIGNNFIRPNKGEKQQATVELITSDTIRLTFRRKFSWKPGQHAYITVPKISKLPSEAHPFTIATIPTSLDGSPAPAERDVVFLIRARNGFTRHLKEYAVKGEKKTVTAIVDGPYGLPPTLHQFSTCILVAGTTPDFVSRGKHTLMLLANRRERYLVHASFAFGLDKVRIDFSTWVRW